MTREELKTLFRDKALPAYERALEEMKEKLKPCPFCGSDNLLVFKNLSKDGSVTYYSIVHPPQANCSVDMLSTNRRQLIEKWNKRIEK